MRISNANSQSDENIFGSEWNVAVPREVYNRLQMTVMFPIGSGVEDTTMPLKAFYDAMNAIQDGTNTNQLAVKVDEFLGSLGVDMYYPHPDNTYKGELLNA